MVEDIFRYAYNHKEIASGLKTLRHDAKLPKLYVLLLESRNSEHDVLRPSTRSEMIRSDINSTLIANFKRSQEAARVLEEMVKSFDVQSAENFKNSRYALYTFEKKAFAYLEEIKSTSNSK